MLQGSLSTQDEEDVEDELEALRAEVAEPVHLPAAPTKEPPRREPVRQEEVEVEADVETETRTALPA
jgi:charged multivesicular body protein 6